MCTKSVVMLTFVGALYAQIVMMSNIKMSFISKQA
jgi:hypothetical protein